MKYIGITKFVKNKLHINHIYWWKSNSMNYIPISIHNLIMNLFPFLFFPRPFRLELYYKKRHFPSLNPFLIRRAMHIINIDYWSHFDQVSKSYGFLFLVHWKDIGLWAMQQGGTIPFPTISHMSRIWSQVTWNSTMPLWILETNATKCAQCNCIFHSKS